MEETIQIRLTPTREIYYSNDSNFGTYVFETEDNVELKVNNYKNYSLKGKTMRLQLEQEYNAILVKTYDKKYGHTYEIKSIYQDIPTDVSKQKAFLSYILTDNQVANIYKAYPNQDVIKLIKEGKFDYKKVKGVGERSFEKIRDKIIENTELNQAIDFLGEYNVSHNMIIKLVKHFNSASLLIQEMQKNPYVITEVSGIGFKKADAIAMSMGFNQNSKHRILSAIEYVVDEESGNGHTYVEVFDCIKKVYELISVPTELISMNIVDTRRIVVVEDRIALKRNYDAEKYIAKRIKELNEGDTGFNFDVEGFVNSIENEHKITLTNQQKSFFDNVKKHRFHVLTGFAGCVDSETEFFNGKEWKSIANYEEGDKVLQYNEGGTTTLVEPIKYHKLPESKMTLIKNKSGSINQCVSNEHTMIYKTSKGHLASKPFFEFKKFHDEKSNGFYGKFISTFEYSGKGIELTDDEIRVMVMVIADGHFLNPNIHICRVNIKKDRKKERLVKLLNNANIDYTYRNKKDGYVEFKFIAPWIMKKFDSIWYNCTQHQLQIVTDEVLHWDGSIGAKGRRRFSSHVKESAEFIQFAFSATGYRATIREDNRVGQKYKDSKYIRKSIGYEVFANKNKHGQVSLLAKKPEDKSELIDIKPKDGYKYCFTVPSGMWIMRRGYRICVTGNCGKSQMVTFLIQLLEKLRVSYKMLSPTGKAAKVLSNYTNRPVETIHRGIGLGGGNEDEAFGQLDAEYIIVDEMSMTDVSLCAKLLYKCTNENVKVLFIGDPAQIPSVSAGNVLHDLIESNVVPVTILDVVFRQKEGGILDIATKVRQKQKFVDNDFVGIKTYGNNCVLVSVPQEKMVSAYKYYLNELIKKYQVEDITIVTPTKKGDLGTVSINKHVQSVVNPSSGVKKEKEYGFDKNIFRDGDMVINTKNSYRIENMNGDIVNIVNGDIGKIEAVDLDEEDIVINFDFDTIPIEFKKLDQLLHAWCLTMHKMQGSASKAIIAIADRSHKFQLNANLIYTAFTRPEEMLIIISQAETLNYAIRKVANLQRRTFLQEMLKGDS